MKDPELAGIQAEIEVIRESAHKLSEGLSHMQLMWRPAPNSWSIAECLEHLLVTGRMYIDDIIPLVEKGRAQGITGTGPFRHGLLGNWFARSLEPPGKFKVRAPAIMEPSTIENPGQVVQNFLSLQTEILELLPRIDGLKTSKLKARSRVIKPLRLDIYQWLASTASHERRHLWQANNVRQSVDFPKE